MAGLFKGKPDAILLADLLEVHLAAYRAWDAIPPEARVKVKPESQGSTVLVFRER